MSAIRERTVLCVVDLPKTLTSHRNLQAYFSRFGEIKKVSLNKDVKSAMIQFSTHFDAQAAKTQGKIYNNEPLNIFWSDCTSLDPRAKETQDNVSNTNELWGYNDHDNSKEYFGVENSQTTFREERRQSVKEKIKQHLTVPIKLSVKQRLSGPTSFETGIEKKVETSNPPKSPIKLNKIGSKRLMAVKKSATNSIIKRKIVKKEANASCTARSKLKKLVGNEVKKNPSVFQSERTDLKDKLALLYERDKSMRMGTVQYSNIKTAVAIKGTCPDMCPERERIMRQYSHSFATYEMIPGTNEMDENRAVKEYSRSSADQEAPLPHDLRPEPVLSMTMDYLITNIISRVDNKDENKAIWYSFCLNRLRSIRKDLILQHLCSMETVTIVEKCARFHICCYDHMWGADISGFSDKNNINNLMDCLQTLKHMYEDLGKHGVSCPNEPEFYLYLILLGLKSGDVMCEYQQYSSKIRHSPEVQFGIAAYMAFQNNMYSRYFRLVKKGTYLTACLMQRYFDQVRTQALKTMLKAYCLPRKTDGLSSSFVVSSLKFDSHKNALRFWEQEEVGVDIKVDSDDNETDQYVSTSSFLIREKRLPIAKAIVGQGPLPGFTLPQVHSSFDELGRLKSIFELDENGKDINVNEELRPHKKEESSGINIPVETNPSDFKFSLSPTKVQVNSFGNFFPNEFNSEKNHQPSVEAVMNIDHVCLEPSLGANMNVAAPSNIFEVRQDLEDCKEDIDMICEDSEMPQESVFTIPYEMLKPKDKFKAFQKPQIRAQIPFSIPSISYSTAQKSIWPMGKDNQVINEIEKQPISLSEIQNLTDAKSENEGISGFSFSLSDRLQSHSHVIIPDTKTDTLAFQTQPSSRNDTINNKSSTTHIQVEPEHALSDAGLEQSAGIKMLKSLLEESNSELNKDEEYRTLLREIILVKEEFEKKRLEIKESLRLEKEKKSNQMLRKYIRQRFKVISARKCARQWREKIEKLKKSRADFPSLVQLSVEDHLSRWGSINSIPTNSIFLRARDQRKKLRIISRILNSGITDSCKYIGSVLAETLANSAATTMKKGSIKSLYWKLGISVPFSDSDSPNLSVFNQLMRRWCKQSFYKKEESCLGAVEQVITSLEIPVNMSIHLSDTLQSNQYLNGMDALIFVVLNETESDQMCIKRLQNLVSSQTKDCEFSIAVMNIGGQRLEDVLKVELTNLYEQNKVARWKIFSWSEPKSIIQSLKFLAGLVNVAPNIYACSLNVLVIEILDEFFDALSCSRYTSEKFKDFLRCPNNVIYLYNTCMTKLEDLLMCHKLEKHFNTAEEFKTHISMNDLGGPELMCGKHFNNAYKTQLTKLLKSIKLPEFLKWPVRSSNHLVESIKAYCIQINSLSIFPNIIRMLDIPNDGNLQQHFEQVSWLNIVELWVQCNIRDKLSNRGNKRMFVVVDKNDVLKLIKDQWWLKHPIVIHHN